MVKKIEKTCRSSAGSMGSVEFNHIQKAADNGVYNGKHINTCLARGMEEIDWILKNFNLHFKKEIFDIVFLSNEKIRILDVGCATGRTLKEFAKYFYELGIKNVELIGVDINPLNNLSTRKHDHMINFITGNAENLNMIKSNSIDFVWSMATSQYVPNSLKFLEEVRRVIKVGKRAIISLAVDESEIINNHSLYDVLKKSGLDDEIFINNQVETSELNSKGRKAIVIEKKDEVFKEFKYKLDRVVNLFPEAKNMSTPASKHYVTGEYSEIY